MTLICRAISLFVLCLSTTVLADEFRFLIKNPDFSAGLNHWTSTEQADWIVENGAIKSDRNRDSSLPKNAVSESSLSQCTDIEGLAGFKAALKFRFTKPPSLKTAVARIVSYFDKDCNGQGEAGNYFFANPVTDWQVLTIENVVLSMGARSAKFELMQPGEITGSNPRYWDDILFVSTTSKKSKALADKLPLLVSGENLVKNGAFNVDIEHWKLFYGSWSREGRTKPGSGSTKLSSTSGGFGTMVGDQCVDVGKNEIYKYKASFKKNKASSQTGRGNIRVIWYEEPGCKGQSKIGERLVEDDRKDSCVEPKKKFVIEDDENGWIRMELSKIHRPPTATSVKVEFGQTIDGPGEFEIFWDDISFAPE